MQLWYYLFRDLFLQIKIPIHRVDRLIEKKVVWNGYHSGMTKLHLPFNSVEK